MASDRHCIPISIVLDIIKRDHSTCQYCGKQGEFVYRYGKPCVIENPHDIDIKALDFYNGTDVIPFEIDHITPVSKGGEVVLENLILSCRHCNRSKGDRDSNGKAKETNS